jgi:hypothetical protein
MLFRCALFGLLLAFLAVAARGQEPRKPRVIVLTDIGNEPDDAQSLVRFLVYANVFEVEGLIATTSTWLRDGVQPERIRGHIDAYGEVRDNLSRHADGYPTVESLDAVVRTGQPAYGMEAVGEGLHSPGSDLIIEAVDRADERPVWVAVWGGANTLAQALWDVRQRRSPAAAAAFVAKLRVYAIADQDDAGPWLRATFPSLFYIVSPSPAGQEDYAGSTWTGISGERWYKSFSGPDSTMVGNPWLREHVRTDHGPLGARYPATEYIMEGDTPSFLNLIPNGLAAHEDPTYGGWGGRYRLSRPEGEPRPIYTDAPDTVTGPDGDVYTSNQATIWRWRAAYQNDFAARMDWCRTPVFREANHNPIPLVNGTISAAAYRVTALPGQILYLNAEGSHDPDTRDSVRFRWWVYPEAGTYPGEVVLRDDTAELVSFVVPDDAGGTEIPVMLEVIDSGTPALTSSRRAIVRVTP